MNAPRCAKCSIAHDRFWGRRDTKNKVLPRPEALERSARCTYSFVHELATIVAWPASDRADRRACAGVVSLADGRGRAEAETRRPGSVPKALDLYAKLVPPRGGMSPAASSLGDGVVRGEAADQTWRHTHRAASSVLSPAVRTEPQGPPGLLAQTRAVKRCLARAGFAVIDESIASAEVRVSNKSSLANGSPRRKEQGHEESDGTVGCDRNGRLRGR